MNVYWEMRLEYTKDLPLHLRKNQVLLQMKYVKDNTLMEYGASK
jgi:hypothetical protein